MSASSPLPDHAWIAARIPHAGTMCLLDRVLAWDSAHIHCLATSHTGSDHPLACTGALGMANGIEYAAQAMAVHGALVAGSDTAPAAGFLTSVRDVQWDGTRLDTLGAQLQVHAERLSGDAHTILYGFRLEASGRTVLGGRASVMLEAPPVALRASPLQGGAPGGPAEPDPRVPSPNTPLSAL